MLSQRIHILFDFMSFSLQLTRGHGLEWWWECFKFLFCIVGWCYVISIHKIVFILFMTSLCPGKVLADWDLLSVEEWLQSLLITFISSSSASLSSSIIIKSSSYYNHHSRDGVDISIYTVKSRNLSQLFFFDDINKKCRHYFELKILKIWKIILMFLLFQTSVSIKSYQPIRSFHLKEGFSRQGNYKHLTFCIQRLFVFELMMLDVGSGTSVVWLWLWFEGRWQDRLPSFLAI